MENPPKLPEGFAYATSEELMEALGVPNPKHKAAILDGIASGKVTILAGSADTAAKGGD